MEKYTTFDQIKKTDISSFNGLENEIMTYIYHSSHKVPLSLECFGITFPEPRFHIKRNNSQYFILEYIVSGKGHLNVGNKSFTLHPNDVYLLEPGSSHEYYADKDDPYKKLWINFRSDVFLSIFNEYKLGGIYVFQDTDISKEMEQIFALENISRYNDQIYIAASRHLFSIFMALAAKKAIIDDGSVLARRIRNELDDAITSIVTIEEIAKHLHISRSKLMREFKKSYGVTPYAYLLNRKIGFAKMLLQNTKHSIKTIASLLNFADVHYLGNVFKSKTGMTPGDYRKPKPNIPSK